jgi:hypothetical protein
MNQNTITMQVVGRPRTVTLGVPIQQRGSLSSKESLHWRRGEWAGQQKGGHREALIQRARRIASRPKWLRAVVLAAAAAVLVGSGLLAYVVPKAGTNQTLPFAAPVQSQGHSSVRIVQEIYQPLGESTQAVAIGRDQPILPPDVIQREANSTPPAETRPVTAVQLPVRREASAVPHGVAAATPTEKTKPAAVILDEAQSAGGQAVRQPLPAVPQKASSIPSGTPDRSTSAPSNASRGTGLVAVTPDGKVAVFTDPQTRMPAQFKVGDRLPNGETLRAIDSKTGKVTTSAKEYELE